MNQIAMLESLIEVLKKQMEIIEQQANDLKCCGNCKKWLEHKCYCFHNWNPHKYCESWRPDGLTREGRA